MPLTTKTLSDQQAALQGAEKLFMAQNFSEAKALCHVALEGNPENSDALRLMGAIFAQTGDAQGAINFLSKACEIQPKNTFYKKTLARTYMAAGYPGKAMAAIMAAIILDPEDDQNKNLFLRWFKVKCIPLSGDYKTVKKVLEICLRDNSLTRKFLISPWLSIITKGDDYRILRDISNCPSYEDFLSTVNEGELKDILNDSLLLAGLPIFCVVDPAFEKALTFLRRYFGESRGDSPLDFIAALGLHCFQNEYVFFREESETALCDTLKDALVSCDPSKEQSRIMVAVYACYRPLNTLANASKICDAASDSDSVYFKDLVRQQIENPLTENKIKNDIPVLTKISDDVSKAVQEQYEENPYPRWHSRRRPASHNLEEHKGEGKTILNAGCGTGQSPISTATAYPGAAITAVDLSLSSLAYAVRQAKEMELKNIDFAQADILEMGAWKEKFDIITSGGVLHHMKDPLEGWRVLATRLKSDGAMQLGLYSELGRKTQIAGQEWIKAHDIPATSEGIRSFRKYIFECALSDPMKALVKAYDFYSLSNCRDLVFHVMEHRFSCLDLAAMMKKLELKFLGFDNMLPSIRQQYQVMFPDDPAMTNLKNWDKFEKKNPQTFASMYKFWCCRENERPANDLPGWFNITS